MSTCFEIKQILVENRKQNLIYLVIAHERTLLKNSENVNTVFHFHAKLQLPIAILR